MDKERILARSFMSIRTYAILAVLAVTLMILLFSAGCSGETAKSLLCGRREYAAGDRQISVDSRMADPDVNRHEIRIGI